MPALPCHFGPRQLVDLLGLILSVLAQAALAGNNTITGSGGVRAPLPGRTCGTLYSSESRLILRASKDPTRARRIGSLRLALSVANATLGA